MPTEFQVSSVRRQARSRTRPAPIFSAVELTCGARPGDAAIWVRSTRLGSTLASTTSGGKIVQRTQRNMLSMWAKRRYLPSLSSFATFEVAAKHLSFTLAGNELCVTQAAVSQQIRGLEKALGVMLFLRKHNGLELTTQGNRLLSAVSNGLDSICEAVDEFNQSATPPVITCSGTNAAVAYWLKPYVARFRATRPELRFVLLASDEDDTLRNFDEVDISFICGNERCEVGELLYYLFPELVEPVCSPDYLRRRGPFPDSASLAEADLLELHSRHWTSEAIGWSPITWNDWFGTNGFVGRTSSPALVSNGHALLTDAAIAGEGVMLGWHHLVRHLVVEGKLVSLFQKPFRVDRGFYLKINKASLDKPYVQEFVDYLLAEAAATETGTLGACGVSA